MLAIEKIDGNPAGLAGDLGLVRKVARGQADVAAEEDVSHLVDVEVRDQGSGQGYCSRTPAAPLQGHLKRFLNSGSF